MSHFTVMVINSKGENDVEEQLAPYHEFECTGVDDQYIEDIDQTAEVQEDFQDNKDDYESIRKFAEDYYGKKLVPFGQQPDLQDDHKYGYYTVDEKGNLLKVVDRTNPNSKWDWYKIGGRWAGFLQLKEGLTPKSAPNFSWGWDEKSKKEILENGLKADSAEKAQIDWEAMMAEGRQSAIERWDKVASVLGVDENGIINQPEFTWLQCRTEKFPDDIQKARDFYHDQPLIKKFNSMDMGFFASIDDYAMTREQKGNLGANNSISTYAVLLDGEWIAKGEMGWFGMSSESDEEARDWSKGFYEKFIEPLSDEALITIVDCHT